MKKYIICSLVGLATLALAGCYEDKGDYDYKDVNEMTVLIPETKLRMPKEEAVEVSIVPQIAQTLEKSEEYLSFEWRRAKPGVKAGSERILDYEPYATGKECKVTVAPYEAENIGLMLIVKDQKNGTTWYQTGEVKIVRPLNPCWFVLQEKEGQGVLGAIEGSPEAYYLYPDVFQSEAGTSFPLAGKPLALSARKDYGNSSLKSMLGMFGFTVSPMLMVVTDRDLALMQPSTLTTKYAAEKILFEPKEKGEVLNVQAYKMNTYGEWFVNNGKSYYAYMDGFCVPFSIKESGTLPSIGAHGSYGSSLLFYDDANHRFLRAATPSTFSYMSNQATQNIRRYGTKWNDQKPVTLFAISGENNVFDPNAISPTLKVRDIVTGGTRGNFAYAVAAPQNGKELTVFKFSAQSGDPACAARYTIGLPPEADIEQAKFAASRAYTANLFFMATGNKLYRVDLDRGRLVELYTYEADAAAQIAAIKFKNPESVRTSDEDEATGAYNEHLGMTLGLGINTSTGKGVVAELQLTVAGDVARQENSVCLYEDAAASLGKIVDITYNYE